MSDPDKRQKGAEVIAQVYGEALPVNLPPKGVNKFIDFMLETLFADLWSCEVLSFKERRLLLLGAIAAQGEESTFSIQAAAALNNGELSAEQLQEAMIFLTQYVGYPKASRLNLAVNELVKKYNEK